MHAYKQKLLLVCRTILEYISARQYPKSTSYSSFFSIQRLFAGCYITSTASRAIFCPHNSCLVHGFLVTSLMYGCQSTG